MFVAFAIAAVCLVPPVDGPVIAGYAPVGQYGGHWGVDYATAVGDPVTAPVSGRVTFAGSVAGMRAVTLEPVGGYKVSVSYLSDVLVQAGAYVRRGSVVGSAGWPHGIPGVHLSTRINGRYVNPMTLLGCASTDISRALHLVTPSRPYPRRRANRNPRRDLRSDPHRPSPHRRVHAVSTRSRPGAGYPRRRPLAEG